MLCFNSIQPFDWIASRVLLPRTDNLPRFVRLSAETRPARLQPLSLIALATGYQWHEIAGRFKCPVCEFSQIKDTKCQRCGFNPLHVLVDRPRSIESRLDGHSPCLPEEFWQSQKQKGLLWCRHCGSLMSEVNQVRNNPERPPMCRFCRTPLGYFVRNLTSMSGHDSRPWS